MKKQFFAGIIWALCSSVAAQDAARNTGNLQVHSGGSFSSFGHFTNASAGVLVNQGSLHVKGNLVNDQSAMAAGTGTLYLSGSVAQNVNGSQPFRTYHLNSNNSSGITINNNLSVSGIHTFTNGIIITSATPNYLIYEAGSSYSGDADSRHVNGWVKKIGATNFIFPVGNGSVERTIALNSLTASSEFNVKHEINTPNLNQLDIQLVAVDTFEYWQVDRVSGGSASVGMNWDNSKLTFPNWQVARIAAAYYTGAQWTDVGGPASGTTSMGTVASGVVSSFGLFTPGYRLFPLPLTLISFTARYQDSRTELKWTTAQEQNVSHFTILRSNDNISFYEAGRTAARNNPGVENYFTYDNEPIHHIAWYKLRSTDTDGREKYSKTVSVSVNNSNRLMLLTNPVRDRITISASSALNAEFTYTITAMNGQLMQKGKLAVAGRGNYPVSIEKKMAPGTYTLEVANHNEVYVFKLVVVR
ncbi:MAG: T9SS type A sorting domain-containing protein [Chitinophagaceae bacterium]|nr:T9SS type A sorting domain-containing protein [Chitinophagaceae bacterium]